MSRKTPTKIFKRIESINNINDNVNVSNKNIPDITKEKLFLSFFFFDVWKCYCTQNIEDAVRAM